MGKMKKTTTKNNDSNKTFCANSFDLNHDKNLQIYFCVKRQAKKKKKLLFKRWQTNYGRSACTATQYGQNSRSPLFG